MCEGVRSANECVTGGDEGGHTTHVYSTSTLMCDIATSMTLSAWSRTPATVSEGLAVTPASTVTSQSGRRWHCWRCDYPRDRAPQTRSCAQARRASESDVSLVKTRAVSARRATSQAPHVGLTEPLTLHPPYHTSIAHQLVFEHDLAFRHRRAEHRCSGLRRESEGTAP